MLPARDTVPGLHSLGGSVVSASCRQPFQLLLGVKVIPSSSATCEEHSPGRHYPQPMSHSPALTPSKLKIHPGFVLAIPAEALLWLSPPNSWSFLLKRFLTISIVPHGQAPFCTNSPDFGLH